MPFVDGKALTQLPPRNKGLTGKDLPETPDFALQNVQFLQGIPDPRNPANYNWITGNRQLATDD